MSVFPGESGLRKRRDKEKPDKNLQQAEDLGIFLEN